MAEVIGMVASGIAIGQATAAITSSLLKLKSLWNEFRDVPDDLLHLVHELEIVCLVLAESDPQGTSGTCTPSSRPSELAWKLTNDGAKELKSLVDDLQTELKQNQRWKGKFVAAKIVTKRDQIKRLKSRLKTCIRLLTLANQSKISSMLERQPGLLAMELTALTRNMDHARQEDEMDQDNTQQISKARTIPQHSKIIQNQSAFQLRFRLFYRQWYFCYHRSCAGWDLVFRIFNIISVYDPLILVCFENDSDEVLREYFRAGKASPLMLVVYDDGSSTDTLLAHAAFMGCVKITQLLLDEGAKILEDSIETYSRAIFHFTVNAVNSVRLDDTGNQRNNEQRLLSLGKILLQDSQTIDQNIDTREDYCQGDWTDLRCFRGTLASFQLLLCLYPNYYSMPFRSRASLTMYMAKEYCNSPDVVRAALGNIDTSQVDLQLFLEDQVPVRDTVYQEDSSVSNQPCISIQSTLWICVAKRFGYSVFESAFKPSKSEIYGPLHRSATDSSSVPMTDMIDEENYPFDGWRSFVRQLIEAGADPSRETPSGTALTGVVAGAFTIDFYKRAWDWQYTVSALEETFRKPNKGRLALLAWLKVLKNCGIDLETYGRKQALIFSREDAAWPGREILLCQNCGLYYRLGLYLRLIGFEFGPNPEDWKFWFSEPTDQLVGEFWDMVEHPERRMPGAWDEFSW